MRGRRRASQRVAGASSEARPPDNDRRSMTVDAGGVAAIIRTATRSASPSGHPRVEKARRFARHIKIYIHDFHPPLPPSIPPKQRCYHHVHRHCGTWNIFTAAAPCGRPNLPIPFPQTAADFPRFRPHPRRKCTRFPAEMSAERAMKLCTPAAVENMYENAVQNLWKISGKAAQQKQCFCGKGCGNPATFQWNASGKSQEPPRRGFR